MIYAVQGFIFRQTYCFIKCFLTLLGSLALLIHIGTPAQAAPDRRNATAISPTAKNIRLCHSSPCLSAAHQPLAHITLHPQVRAQPWQQDLLSLSSTSIQPWLARYLIVPTQRLNQAGYVLGSADQRVIAAVGQQIYVRGSDWVVGQRYSIYRRSEPYLVHSPPASSTAPNPLHRSKSVENTLHEMQELIEVARGEVIEVQPNMANIQLSQSFAAEVRRGDLVFASQVSDFPARFEPVSSEALMAGGQIIRVLGSITFAAKDSIVTIDRGQRHGAQVGQVLQITQRAESLQDPKGSTKVKLPQQSIGHVMVVKSFDELSYAYVLESRVPIYVGAALQTLAAPELAF